MNKDLKIAKKCIEVEIKALKKLSASFNRSSQFSKAVNLISKMKGKCIVIGVGKSYLVGLKVSATLSSLGTPSVAFSANDLQHGGLGAIQKNHDVMLVFSVSGESSELNSILSYANRHNISVIGVSCKSSSMLLRYSKIKILLPKVVEAGHSLAPTSSSLNFLSWGDSFAIACMKRKKFTNRKFVTTHPSGTLARALIQVKEIMVSGKGIPLISYNQNMKKAVNEMSKKKLGIVCIVFSMLKCSKVSFCKSSETTVTASDILIAYSITGLNDLSLPSKVISVPCKVVTIGISMPFVLRICLAFTAAEA